MRVFSPGNIFYRRLCNYILKRLISEEKNLAEAKIVKLLAQLKSNMTYKQK